MVRNYIFVPWDDGENGEEELDQNTTIDGESQEQDSSVRQRRLGTDAGQSFLSAHSDNATSSKKAKQQKRMRWLDREPTRFLYCHQLHETKTTSVSLVHMHRTRNSSFTGHVFVHRYKKSKKKNDYLLSDEFRHNMACYIFFVDPWRVLCDVALEGHCSTERDELRPDLAAAGSGNEDAPHGDKSVEDHPRRTLSMDPKNIRRREKKAQLRREAELSGKIDNEDDNDSSEFDDVDDSDEQTSAIVKVSNSHWRKKGCVLRILFKSSTLPERDLFVQRL